MGRVTVGLHCVREGKGEIYQVKEKHKWEW